MRDLIDILNKILTESQVDEAANLAAGEILSRPGRFEKFINHIKNKQTFDLRQITDLWDQAVIYYYFWIWFGIEVPHNDFANWIDSTDQLTGLL